MRDRQTGGGAKPQGKPREAGMTTRVGKKGGGKTVGRERVQEGPPEMQECKGDKGSGSG